MAKKSINIRAGFDLKAFSTSSQNLTRSLKKTGAKMKSIGKSMSMSLTAPIVGLGGLAVKTFADFEQSMAKVQAISGATGKDFEALTQKAKDLGISTRFAASEVSDLMLNYSKLGFSSDEIQKITGATLDLALATGEDLATSATVAGGTLRAFGLDASQMGMVTDVMAKSFSSSALDLNKFQVSMSSIAPIARGLGQSLQETTAQLGTLVDNGIEASTAGTMLRNMMLKATKDGFSMEEALSDIASSTDKAGTSLKYFDTRATATALVLADNIDKVKSFNDELINAGGSAKEMADIMDDTLEGSMMKLKSATEGLGISFGEVMAPAIGKAADFLSAIALKFSELAPETKKTIAVVAGLAAAIGPLIVAVGALSGALAVIVANPIIFAIAGIAAAFVTLHVAMSDVNKIADKTSKSIQILNNTSKEYTKTVAIEKSVIDDYFKALRNTNKGSQERKSLIDTINRTYGTTLQNLSDETAFVRQLDTAYSDLIKSIDKKVRIQLQEDALKDLLSIEQGLQESIDTLTARRDDIGQGAGAYEDWVLLNKEITTQLFLLEENKKAQEKLYQGSFFKALSNGEITNGVANVNTALSGVSNTIEKVKINVGDIMGGDMLKKLAPKMKEIKPPEIKPIDLKVHLNKSSISTSMQSILSAIDGTAIKAKIKAQEMGREMGAALSSGLKDLATEGLTQLGTFLGDSLTAGTMMNDQLKQTENHYNKMIQAAQGNADEIARIEQEKAQKVAEIQESFSFDNRAKDFGRGLLDSIGKFMGQFGEAMISMGIAQTALGTAISLGPAGAPLAIAGGIALVAAGAAISNLSKKGIGGSDTAPSTSQIGGMNDFGSQAGQMSSMMLETRVSGRDLILVTEREKSFVR